MVAIVDRRISPACEMGLLKRGFRVIKLPPFSSLPEPLSSHPDMLMIASEGEIITSCAYCDEAPYVFSDISIALQKTRLTFTSDTPGERYPYDCIFNALVIGDNLFLKTDTASRELIALAERRGLKLVHTNQGYPACTVLPLGGGAAITADNGLARVLCEEGIDVTVISNADISLPPYDYGFIGGAAGVFEDTVYFLGDPKYHRDSEKIADAIARAGMKFVALADEPLTDLGRIIILRDN